MFGIILKRRKKIKFKFKSSFDLREYQNLGMNEKNLIVNTVEDSIIDDIVNKLKTKLQDKLYNDRLFNLNLDKDYNIKGEIIIK